MISGLINGVDSFFIWVSTILKQSLSDYSDLETAQDKYSLVAKDGSLLSIIKIEKKIKLDDNIKLEEALKILIECYNYAKGE